MIGEGGKFDGPRSTVIRFRHGEAMVADDAVRRESVVRIEATFCFVVNDKYG